MFGDMHSYEIKMLSCHHLIYCFVKIDELFNLKNKLNKKLISVDERIFKIIHREERKRATFLARSF